MKNEQYQKMWEDYSKGFSLEEVGEKFGVTRQCVYVGLKRRGHLLRKTKKLPFKIFRGEKFTLRNSDYYGSTKGKRRLMHRVVWEFYHGKIPKGFDIHHKNHNRHDNRISNLDLLPKDIHAKLFATGNNQYQKRKPSWKSLNSLQV